MGIGRDTTDFYHCCLVFCVDNGLSGWDATQRQGVKKMVILDRAMQPEARFELLHWRLCSC